MTDCSVDKMLRLASGGADKPRARVLRLKSVLPVTVKPHVDAATDQAARRAEGQDELQDRRPINHEKDHFGC
ncbi:hypothetical protein VPNG_04267 [Cytospora leucostoma]|uniref:Uncharacterized protein n=1 Tax=Cytospora leucostoma TaxID=1230097 RepID=A0A423XDJ3_9PEZI|nr:hypothetical protein VPNG_04267 [Cytospora leucostoma]